MRSKKALGTPGFSSKESKISFDFFFKKIEDIFQLSKESRISFEVSLSKESNY